jgi:hypothetical protein
MTAGGLSENVQSLLRERLRSFEGLEVLVLLHAQPSRSWTEDAIGALLRLDFERVREALAELISRGLARQSLPEPASYAYHAGTPQVAAAVDELANAYREQHATVMSQMNANAIERIRSGTLKAFADSFILGRKKSDD